MQCLLLAAATTAFAPTTLIHPKPLASTTNDWQQFEVDAWRDAVVAGARLAESDAAYLALSGVAAGAAAWAAAAPRGSRHPKWLARVAASAWLSATVARARAAY